MAKEKKSVDQGPAVIIAAIITTIGTLIGALVGVFIGRSTDQYKPQYEEISSMYALVSQENEQLRASTTDETSTNSDGYEVGEAFMFGGNLWRVLETDNDGLEALVISEHLIESRAFDEAGGTRWDNCSLRAYLNGAFYNGFSSGEKARIIETQVTTPGSLVVLDNVFLLSIQQVKNYFTNGDQFAFFKDDKEKIAKYWWTRSPSFDNHGDVNGIDTINSSADYFTARAENTKYDYICVRPAMWIKAE